MVGVTKNLYNQVPSTKYQSPLILAIVLISLLGISRPVYAESTSASVMPRFYNSSYSCINPHCYGEAYWNGAISGSTVRMAVEHLTEPSGGGAYSFIDQEEWLNNCSFGSQCAWAEMGYTDGLNGAGSAEDYFYGGSYDGVHIGNYLEGVVPSGDYGGYTTIALVNVSSQGYVEESFSTPTFDAIQYYYESITPEAYTFGSELYGSSGGSSPITTYIDNGFYNTSGTLIWQQAQPGTSIKSPQQFSIITKPASGNYGGTFHASCGC